MGSKQNESTRFFSSSEPNLCINGCGFFGTASNMNLCSKCYQEKAAFEKSVNPKPKTPETTTVESIVVVASSSSSTRCLRCNKKVGLMGFKCKCGSMFCGSHRYPEDHECEFDFKGEGRDAIGKANPVVIAEKVERI